MYEKLELPQEYEIYNKEKVLDNEFIRFAKRYGDIFNKYESVNIVYKNNVLQYVEVFEYKPSNTEIRITEEMAKDILNENNISYDSITLDFKSDNINLQFDSNNTYEYIDYLNNSNDRNYELDIVNFNIRLVWTVIKNNSEIYYLDAQDGILTKREINLDEEKKE